VLFYLIVLYGCVCQPLINGYDDDDGSIKGFRKWTE